MTGTDLSSEDVMIDKLVIPKKKTQRQYKNGENLYKATKYLKFEMKRRKRLFKNPLHLFNTEYCREQKFSEFKYNMDARVQLHCRQLPMIIHELRKTILHQDWDIARVLLSILSHSGLLFYSSVIIKTCFILLFSHRKSGKKLLHDFVKISTGYILDEDVDKFIRILFALRQKELPALTRTEIGKRQFYYKITRDPDFEAL